MGWSAFQPKGNTIAISPATASTTPVQAPTFGGNAEQGVTGYLVSNTTSQGCFLAYGPNNQVTCGIPTGAGASSSSGFWIPPTSQASYTFANNCWFAAVCSTGTTTIYITPGDGI